MANLAPFKTPGIRTKGTQGPAGIRFRSLHGSGGTTPATSYSLSGPGTGTVGTPTGNYTVALLPSGGTSGAVVVTPHSTIAGSFSPPNVTLSTGSPSATFTFTPSAAGSGTVSTTNSGALTNPAAIPFASTSGGGGACVHPYYVAQWKGAYLVTPGTTGPIAWEITRQDGEPLDQPTSVVVKVAEFGGATTAEQTLTASDYPAGAQQLISTTFDYDYRGQYTVSLSVTYPNGDVAGGSVLVLCNQ